MEELKKRGTVSNLSPKAKTIEKHLKYGDKIEGVSICYPLIKTAGGRQKVAVVNENILYEMIFMSHTEIKNIIMSDGNV